MNTNGQAIIEDGCIVIRVSLDSLPQVIEGAWACGKLNPRFKITNIEEFSKDLLQELNREEEDGTTRVHMLFDGAIDEAINQGAFGIEEHEDQEC